MKQIFFNGATGGSPNDPAWHAWRANGIGASDAVVIAYDAGLITEVPDWVKSPAYLFEIKTGKREPEKVNPAMVRGTAGEGPARRAWETATGLFVQPAFGEMDESPFIRASFDGVGFDHNLNVEIKCPNEKVHKLAKEGIVVEYYTPQLAHQSMVLWGKPGPAWHGKEVHFTSFVPESGEIAIVKIDPVTLIPLAEQLYEAEVKFWTQVQANISPAGAAWDGIAARFVAASAIADAAKREVDAIRAELVAMANGAEKIEGGGVILTTVEKSGTIDYQKAAAALAQEHGISPTFFEGFRGEKSKVTFVKVQKAASYEPKDPAKRTKKRAPDPEPFETTGEAFAW